MKKKLFFRISKLMAFLAAMSFTANSCSIDPLVQELKNAREQAIFAIDDAINQLNLDSESWRFTLEDLNDKLSDDVQTTLSFNVPFILNVLNGEATSGLQCIADAMASKAIYMLQVLKSELITNEPVPLPAPLICNTSVGTIDLNAPRDIRRTVTYYGANLFSKDSLKLQLVCHTGEVQPVSLYKPTQYELVADLSPFSDQETSHWNYLALKYRNEEISTMAIVKYEQQPPMIRSVDASIPQAGVFPHQSNIHGDNYFQANTKVLISARLLHNRKEAYLRLLMFADEISDRENDQTVTRAYGDTRHVFYTAPVGWHIHRIEGSAWYPRLFYFVDNDNEEDIEPTELGQITVIARNSVAGSSTKCVLNSNRQVTIVLEEDE